MFTLISLGSFCSFLLFKNRDNMVVRKNNNISITKLRKQIKTPSRNELLIFSFSSRTEACDWAFYFYQKHFRIFRDKLINFSL